MAAKISHHLGRDEEAQFSTRAIYVNLVGFCHEENRTQSSVIDVTSFLGGRWYGVHVRKRKRNQTRQMPSTLNSSRKKISTDSID